MFYPSAPTPFTPSPSLSSPLHSTSIYTVSVPDTTRIVSFGALVEPTTTMADTRTAKPTLDQSIADLTQLMAQLLPDRAEERAQIEKLITIMKRLGGSVHKLEGSECDLLQDAQLQTVNSEPENQSIDSSHEELPIVSDSVQSTLNFKDESILIPLVDAEYTPVVDVVDMNFDLHLYPEFVDAVELNESKADDVNSARDSPVCDLKLKDMVDFCTPPVRQNTPMELIVLKSPWKPPDVVWTHDSRSEAPRSSRMEFEWFSVFGIAMKTIGKHDMCFEDNHRNSRGLEAMKLFLNLRRTALRFDDITLSGVFRACADIKGLSEGIQLHGLAVKSTFASNVCVANAIVDMYGKYEAMSEAQHVLHDMVQRDGVSWNSINPLVRAWALRTLAGIRLHVVSPIVLLAVGKCVRDPSVYVRKCAATALPKLHDLRIEENTSALEEMVGILLQDHSPVVVGAASAAFAYICPKSLFLIGRNYTKLCEMLPDVEEWGQIALIAILLRYVIARHGLTRESIMYFSTGTEEYGPGEDTYKDEDASEKQFTLCRATHTDIETNVSEMAKMGSWCYIEGPDEYLYRLSNTNEDSIVFDSEYFTSSNNNGDVKLLLQCTSPLMWSQNSAVVVAAASVHWIMGPKENIDKIVKPLLFLLRSSHASQYVVLCNIQQFAKTIPSLFSMYYEDFFILSSDPYQIKAMKLEILSSIATESSISYIFQEFQDYITDPDRRFAADTVAATALCVQRLPKVASLCLEGFLVLIREESLSTDLVSFEGEDHVLVQAVLSIKSIIQRDAPKHEKVLALLFHSFDSIKVPAARAIIVWMIGEYGFVGGIVTKMLPALLSYLAGCFCKEAPATRLQIINTIFKMLFQAKEEHLATFRKVFDYVLDLAKCDINYDIRDRARIIEQLHLCNFCSWCHRVKDMTCLPEFFPANGQANQKLHSPTSCRFYLPGSLSQIVLHAAPGYEPLPKPCSLIHDDCGPPSELHNETSEDESVDHDSYSGSSEEGNVTPYSSQHSATGYSDETGCASEYKYEDDPLIQLSDGNGYVKKNLVSGTDGLDQVLSKTALESWLGEQPGPSKAGSAERNRAGTTSARLLIGDLTERVKPKVYSLLNPANGNGLEVDYSFSSEISNLSPLLVCVLVSFRNCSSDRLTNILLADEDSLKEDDQKETSSRNTTASDKDAPILTSMDEISTLEPGQRIDKSLHVHFHHHLLPVKLVLLFNDKKLPVKLWPDIGYFVKPLLMGIEDFKDKESRLRGMFEYLRRCTFTDHIKDLNKDNNESLPKDKFLAICQSLAIKMLSNTNTSLVSADLPVTTKLDDASGLCLRFSSELLSSSYPCLISVTVEDGKCHEPLNVSVKVNCEETVFGLNLLNRIINLLVEPCSTDKQT